MSQNHPPVSRVDRTKQEAKTTYNRLSRWYDLIAGTSETKFRKMGRRMLNIQPGEIILEIGCGTGANLTSMARAAGPSGRLYGIDLAEGMLDVTRQRVQEADLTARVSLNQGDAGALPYPARFFDVIFMSFVLELFDTPEMPNVIQECRRVLKGTGRMAVVSLAKKSDPNLALRIYEWAHHTFPTYADCRPIFVEQTVAEGGFEIGEAKEKSMWGLPVKMIVARPIQGTSTSL